MNKGKCFFMEGKSFWKLIQGSDVSLSQVCPTCGPGAKCSPRFLVALRLRVELANISRDGTFYGNIKNFTCLKSQK